MPSCRSCGAEIVWALSGNEKRMPVDAEPTAEGNVALVEVDGDLHARVAAANLLEEPRYTSHFATCPNADAHRRPRAA